MGPLDRVSLSEILTAAGQVLDDFHGAREVTVRKTARSISIVVDGDKLVSLSSSDFTVELFAVEEQYLSLGMRALVQRRLRSALEKRSG